MYTGNGINHKFEKYIYGQKLLLNSHLPSKPRKRKLRYPKVSLCAVLCIFLIWFFFFFFLVNSSLILSKFILLCNHYHNPVLEHLCHTKLLSIVPQALCLPDLIPWIYSSPPLYNHKGFDLGNKIFQRREAHEQGASLKAPILLPNFL